LQTTCNIFFKVDFYDYFPNILNLLSLAFYPPLARICNPCLSPAASGFSCAKHTLFGCNPCLSLLAVLALLARTRWRGFVIRAPLVTH